jgi:DNA-binding MurR/RpiR family transcriptional regulator
MLGEASTVFAFGLAFAIAMLLYLSIKLSRLGLENHMLSRELALLRYELEEMRGSAGKEPQ